MHVRTVMHERVCGKVVRHIHDVCMSSSVRMCVNVLSGSCKDKHDEVYMYMHTCAFDTDMRAGMCARMRIGTSSLNRGAAVNL